MVMARWASEPTSARYESPANMHPHPEEREEERESWEKREVSVCVRACVCACARVSVCIRVCVTTKSTQPPYHEGHTHTTTAA